MQPQPMIPDDALPEPPEDGGSLTTDDLAEAAAGMAIARARLNAMAAIDATVRAARPVDLRGRLESLAALVATLPRGLCAPRLYLGVTAEGCSTLRALGGVVDTSIYPDATAIDGVTLAIAGMEVTAIAHRRDATPDEMAERERREERAADLRLPPVVLS